MNNDFYNYKPKLSDHIKGIWKHFWWDYISTGPIIYGGKTRGYYKFRWQRLFNIVMVIVFITIILIIKK